MIKTAIPLFMILLFFCNISFAETMKRQPWAKSFKRMTVAQFCADEKFHQKCYKLTHYECTKRMNQALNTCIKAEKLPKRITLGRRAEKFGVGIGICAGKAFEKSVSLNKKSSECLVK